MKILSRLLPVTLLAPIFMFAQGTSGSGPGNLTGVATFLRNLVGFMNNVLVPAIFALAFLIFIWGMFKFFILGGHDTEKQEEGKSLMLYAIAGFVVMISLWGIVNLVANGFGFDGQGPQNLPTGPIPGTPRP